MIFLIPNIFVWSPLSTMSSGAVLLRAGRGAVGLSDSSDGLVEKSDGQHTAAVSKWQFLGLPPKKRRILRKASWELDLLCWVNQVFICRVVFV